MFKRKHKADQRDAQHELSRRALIKWSLFAGAALGVGRSRICEVLDQVAGSSVAYAAEDKTAGYVIVGDFGNGGLSNLNLLWPHVDVAKARNPGFSWHAVGQEEDVVGTDKPLVRGPETPWRMLNAKKQVTCFMAGANQTHKASADFDVGGMQIIPILSAIQTARASILPMIGVGEVSYSVAGVGGAPAIATVSAASDVVGLFNSAASRAGGLLEAQPDAVLYKAHYEAFASLNRAANRPTTTRAYQTANSAAKFLGTNLASVLAITPDEEALYGISGDMPENIAEFARGCIVAVKAFSLGLTNGVILPGMRDDPHGRFGDGSAQPTALHLGRALDGLMNHLSAKTDPNGKTLADVTTIVFKGDTPKDPLDRNVWPDNTPQNSNWVYVYGAGYLKSGWFGGVDRGGGARGFDPATGADAPFNSGDSLRAAAAAIAFAVARGDMRRVQDFINGVDINGLVNLQLV